MKEERLTTFTRYVLYFLIYCVLGSIAETLFRWATEGHLSGVTGFLYLPLMPLYAFGALLLIPLSRLVRQPVVFFLVATIATSILEFIGHWLIEVIFNVRIWDYSHKPFNIDGRVSLDNSLAFGMGALALVYFIHPLVEKLFDRLPKEFIHVAGIVTFAVLVIDSIFSSIRWLG